MQNIKIQSPVNTTTAELQERLVDFGVRLVALSSNLPRTAAGKHLGAQILRSGTSPAPNYCQARGAGSDAESVAKLRLVFQELNETAIWLRIIERSQILRRDLIREVIGENAELCRILAAALKTARGPSDKELNMRNLK